MFSSNTDSLGYQSFNGASWTLVSSLHLRDTIKGLSLVLGPLFNPDVRACVLGLRAYYFKPHQLLPQLLTKGSVGKGCITPWIRCDTHVTTQEGFD